MHDGSGRIVVQGLSKQFGSVTAVQNLSFVVEPGSVTGFLGPNGAGKTTTLRTILGLVSPTTGSALVNGVSFGTLTAPGRVVGAVLEAQGFHPGRTALNHLRLYAAAIGEPPERAQAVLGLVGLAPAGNRKAGTFSLGMRQRLALATALLGDPQILILDEPGNGLDPEGIAWLRTFLRAFAGTGRTVLVSSHLLAEVEQTVDQVIIISRGQTMYNGSLAQLRGSQPPRVLVEPSDPQKLIEALHAANIFNIESAANNQLIVNGVGRAQVGDIALAAGVSTYRLDEESANLERLYFMLTNGQYTPGMVGPGVPQVGYQPPPPSYQGYQQPVAQLPPPQPFVDPNAQQYAQPQPPQQSQQPPQDPYAQWAPPVDPNAQQWQPQQQQPDPYAQWAAQPQPWAPTAEPAPPTPQPEQPKDDEPGSGAQGGNA